MNLEVEIKCRVPAAMKTHLQDLARREGVGVSLSHMIRKAIEQTYFKAPYPITEVTALRAAEEPKAKTF